MRIVFFILVEVFLFSCVKDPEIGRENTMNATVDGASWESVTASTVITNTGISIIGLNKDNEAIELDVLKGTTPGSYSITGGNVNALDAAISLSPSNGSAYASIHYANTSTIGTITISQIDDVNKTISGSFSGLVKRFDPNEKEVVISNGSFAKIPYTLQPVVSGNTFTAKIDGLRLAPTTITGTNDANANVILLSFSTASKNITISLLNSIGRGTYNMGSPGNDYYGTYTTDTKYFPSYAGTITITSHHVITKRIEGTFSFLVQPDVPDGTFMAISEGTFAVSYQ